MQNHPARPSRQPAAVPTVRAVLCLLATLALPVGAAADVIDLTGTTAEQTLSALQTTIAAEPANFAARRDAGIILHQRARTEPREDTVAASEAYLKEALALRPDDLETQAWLGSVTTMKAIFLTDPGKQTFFVKLGTRQLDQAVRAAPDDPLLRLIRGHNSMELPVFLKRTRFAVEDFTHYLDLCQSRDCPPHRVAEAERRLTEAQATVAAQQ